MSLDAQQLQVHCDCYHIVANRLRPGTARHVAMLGMMACCAASWARFLDMPAEWAWPRAVNHSPVPQ